MKTKKIKYVINTMLDTIDYIDKHGSSDKDRLAQKYLREAIDTLYEVIDDERDDD